MNGSANFICSISERVRSSYSSEILYNADTRYHNALLLLLLLLLQNDFHYSINSGAAKCSETQITVKNIMQTTTTTTTSTTNVPEKCVRIVFIYLLVSVSISFSSSFQCRLWFGAKGADCLWMNAFLTLAHWPHRCHRFVSPSSFPSSVLFYLKIHLVNLVFCWHCSSY